jgi:hypothetical protein
LTHFWEALSKLAPEAVEPHGNPRVIFKCGQAIIEESSQYGRVAAELAEDCNGFCGRRALATCRHECAHDPLQRAMHDVTHQTAAVRDVGVPGVGPDTRIARSAERPTTRALLGLAKAREAEPLRSPSPDTVSTGNGSREVGDVSRRHV